MAELPFMVGYMTRCFFCLQIVIHSSSNHLIASLDHEFDTLALSVCEEEEGYDCGVKGAADNS